MEQEFKTITATALATDLGEFTAIAAAWTVDREKDQIHPGAFAGTIKHWRRSGKQLPLHWDHKGGPENVIGHIDPQSMRETAEGLLVKGKLDIENSDMAKEAWRLVKSGTVGLSFGYLVPEGGETKRAGGGRDLSNLDVFEISITPAPMNPDTRILSAKSLEEEVKELRRQTEQQQRELMAANLPETTQVADDPGLLLKGMLDHARKYCDAHEKSDDVRMVQDLIPALEGLIAEDESARLFIRKIADEEMAGVDSGEIKAVWSTAYVNNLPDSAFLYVEDGGTKDGEGKTAPRSLRYFPYKDASGAVDLPHLRNALARIPQSSLSQAIKDTATAKAQKILDSQKSVERVATRDADPHRRRIEQAMLGIQSDGVSSRKSPPVEEKREAQAPPEDQLRRQTRDQYLEILTSTRSW